LSKKKKNCKTLVASQTPSASILVISTSSRTLKKEKKKGEQKNGPQHKKSEEGKEKEQGLHQFLTINSFLHSLNWVSFYFSLT
jgi:hypothetical protein